MAASAADVINIDLEDSVAPSDKDMARANAIEAINTVDWGGKKTLSVRINGLDTPYWYRDVVDLMEQAGDRLDQIMIPKWAAPRISMRSTPLSPPSNAPRAAPSRSVSR